MSLTEINCILLCFFCNRDVIILFYFVIGLIKQVVQHRAQLIYTRTTKAEDPVA